jgi:hypothetical protein
VLAELFPRRPMNAGRQQAKLCKRRNHKTTLSLSCLKGKRIERNRA